MGRKWVGLYRVDETVSGCAACRIRLNCTWLSGQRREGSSSTGLLDIIHRLAGRECCSAASERNSLRNDLRAVGQLQRDAIRFYYFSHNRAPADLALVLAQKGKFEDGLSEDLRHLGLVV